MIKDFIITSSPLFLILLVGLLSKTIKFLRINHYIIVGSIVLFLILQFLLGLVFTEPNSVKGYILVTVLAIVISGILFAGRNYLLITGLSALLICGAGNVLKLSWISELAAVMAFITFSLVIIHDILYEFIKEN